MKRIEIVKIELTHFLSTGKNVTHEFGEGIFFVRGENRTEGQEDQNNGVGKTAIFLDSIVYALYDETSRKIKKSEIPYNAGTQKKCEVTATLKVDDKDIIIYRSINPSKFILTVDGKDKSQSQSKATQEYLEREILGGIKKEIFRQAIAMKMGSSTPFLSMGKPEREKFVGGIFDLSYLKEGEKEAREEYNSLSKDRAKKEGAVETYSQRFTQLKQTILQAKKDEESRKENLVKKKAQVEQELDDLEKPEQPVKGKLLSTDGFEEKLQTILDKTQTVQQSSSKLSRKKTELSTNNRNDLSRIKELENSKVCPTCNREHDEKSVREANAKVTALQKEIIERKLQIEDTESKVEKLETAWSKLRDTEKTIRNKIQAVNQSNSVIDSTYQKQLSEFNLFEERKKNLERQIAEIQDQHDESNNTLLTQLKKDILDVKSNWDTSKEELITLTEDLEVLDSVKFLFGEKGLRAVILGKIVSLFNGYLNDYLERLEAPCTITFDQDFDFEIKNLNSDDISFDNLSSGEQLRVNTALAFTFKDILRVQNQIQFNVGFFDEFFDSAGDGRYLDAMSEIIKERFDTLGESSYIISHRQDFEIEGMEEILVIKENGKSRIE